MNIALSPATGLTGIGGAIARVLDRRPTTRRAVVIPAVGQPLRLQRGAILAVAHPLGYLVRCVTGALWVTHDGDPKDIILAAGQAYYSDRRTRMLVQALQGDAELALATARYGAVGGDGTGRAAR